MTAYEAGGAAPARRWPSIPALARRSPGPLPNAPDFRLMVEPRITKR